MDSITHNKRYLPHKVSTKLNSALRKIVFPDEKQPFGGRGGRRREYAAPFFCGQPFGDGRRRGYAAPFFRRLDNKRREYVRLRELLVFYHFDVFYALFQKRLGVKGFVFEALLNDDAVRYGQNEPCEEIGGDFFRPFGDFLRNELLELSVAADEP